MNPNLSPSSSSIFINGRDVLSDPGLAQLRRYLPVLAVVAAPYAGLGGDQDPLNPLDRAGEWRALVQMVSAVTDLQPANGARLALARLDPPTAARLGSALAAGGDDAFRVAHFACHGERDMLYLEDDNGHESYAVVEHVTNLFKNSRVQLVMMDGCFSQRLAQMLTAETPVLAVVGTRRRISPDNMLAFTATFYAQIAGGVSVRAAYRAALSGQAGQVDRFELVAREDRHEITLTLPDARLRAARPLIVESPVKRIGVPSLAGFVGRRDELTMLAEDIPAAGVRLLALHGPAGIGKSALAAEFAARFGGRFADGVLWVACNAMTTSAEVVAQVAQFLDLPLHTRPDQVLDALKDRRVLIALDGVDALAARADMERLGAWIRDIPAGSCAILTARHLSALLPREGESRSHTVMPFTYKAARTLAMRLAVERDLEALDVDTIDDFLDRTRQWPALIAQGVTLIEVEGIQAALRDLGKIDPGATDPVTAFVSQRLEALAAAPGDLFRTLIRAQGLTDAFDADLWRVLGGDPAQMALLLRHGLLVRVGAWVMVPPMVRQALLKQSPLNPQQQDLIDQDVIAYLGAAWPDDRAPIQIDRLMWARLNNLRAAVQRQLTPDIGIDLSLLARALTAACPTFMAAGLNEEFLAYAQGFRERLPDGIDLARLQISMGEALGALPDQEGEAGWAFQMTLRLETLDTATRAEACIALGSHLIRVEQPEAAARLLSESLRQLLVRAGRGDVMQAARMAHEWANALVMLGQDADAVRRYEAALAGYAETQDAAQSARAQRDLSDALLRLGDLDRAEDALRRALATAESVGRDDLAGDLRQRLANAHLVRADAAHQGGDRGAEHDERLAAEGYLSDALVDALARDDPAALAVIYGDLGRVAARVGRLDEAVAHAERSHTLLAWHGTPSDHAAAVVALGQLQMARGDSVAAQGTLHTALDLAAALNDPALLAQAAGVLVRVHQIRARRVPQAGWNFRQYTLDQASASRAKLIDLGLGEYANALGDVILSLSR
jgi:tetratricopeptide (TPR) repeat protein